MNELLFEDIVKKIEGSYSNLFLMALDRGYNLSYIVNEISEKIDDYMERNTDVFVPSGFEGIAFVSAVAKEMNASITDVLYMSDVEKKHIVYKLIEKISPLKIIQSDWDYDEDEDKTTIDYVYLFQDNNDANAFFKLTFIKESVESDSYSYAVEATITKDGVNSGVDTDLIYDSVLIWSEEAGEVADFVESVIENLDIVNSSIESEDDEEDTLEPEYDSEDSDDGDSSSRIIVGHKKPEVIDEKTGKKIIDELVTYISNDTRSINLLDKFEGYGDDKPVYRRIVIANTKYAWDLRLKSMAGINLVIERSRNHDYVGNITFTEFKQDRDYDLRNFLINEITDAVAEKYLNKDGFYRFSKPYHLRAQNSTNRTGYGWEWDWSGGYGDYTEGTLYGETTDYVFVGAYITSRYNIYDPDKREVM